MKRQYWGSPWQLPSTMGSDRSSESKQLPPSNNDYDFSVPTSISDLESSANSQPMDRPACQCICNPACGRRPARGNRYRCESHCGCLVCESCVAHWTPTICHWCFNPAFNNSRQDHSSPSGMNCALVYFWYSPSPPGRTRHLAPPSPPALCQPPLSLPGHTRHLAPPRPPAADCRKGGGKDPYPFGSSLVRTYILSSPLGGYRSTALLSSSRFFRLMTP